MDGVTAQQAAAVLTAIMRITFVTVPDNLSGGNRVIAIYAKHRQALGHEVNIVLPPQRLVPKRERIIEALRLLKRGEPRSAVAQLHRLRSAPQTPGFLTRSGCELSVLETFRPVRNEDVPEADVVVATWWETAPWVAAFEASKGAKAYFMQDYGAPGQELDKIMPTWKLGFHIITISEWLRELVKAHVPTATVEVVANAVDLELFRQPPRTMPATPPFVSCTAKTGLRGMIPLSQHTGSRRKPRPSLRGFRLTSSKSTYPPSCRCGIPRDTR